MVAFGGSPKESVTRPTSGPTAEDTVSSGVVNIICDTYVFFFHRLLISLHKFILSDRSVLVG